MKITGYRLEKFVQQLDRAIGDSNYPAGDDLMGMAILTKFTEENDLWRGEIYDPESGKTYRSVIRRKSPTKLEVKGCVGPFCQTQIWTRR